MFLPLSPPPSVPSIRTSTFGNRSFVPQDDSKVGLSQKDELLYKAQQSCLSDEVPVTLCGKESAGLSLLCALFKNGNTNKGKKKDYVCLKLFLKMN